MTCPTLETAAAWVLDELPTDEAERFEEHYFGCGSCFQRALSIERAKKHLATSVPPLLTQKRHEVLAARRRLEAVHVQPGASAVIQLDEQRAVGIWIMHAALEGVTRVDLEARGDNDDVVFAFNDVPFDQERGQVLLACQVHYRALPGGPKLVVKLTEPAGVGERGRELGRYILDHQFDSA